MNLLDQLPCAVVVTNEAGRLLYINAALLALIGGAREDRIGALFEELLPPASKIFLQTHIWPTLLRDGQISEIHLQVSSGDRTRVPVLLNSRRGEHQGAPAYFWSLVSTHERHRFEAELIEQRNLAESAGLALGESQRFIRAITDAIPSMVAYWGKDRRCRFANHAYAQWFGRQPHELIGMSREALLGERNVEWN
ncbi:MAG: PAS domain-containing protein, partial [Acidovorax sp.]|nr:PAS domain-containing protein [Acidovorax sp.]